MIAVEDLHKRQGTNSSAELGAGGRYDSEACPFTSLSVTSLIIVTTASSACLPQLVRLRPAPHCRTPILSYSLRVEPGEPLHQLAAGSAEQLRRPADVSRSGSRELRIEVDLVAEMAVYNPFDFFLEPSAEQFPFAYEGWQLRELEPFLHQEPLTPGLVPAAWRPWRAEAAGRSISWSHSTSRSAISVGYVIRLDPGVQTTEQTLELGTGSCRDTTWLLVQLLRHCGLAARFVSGYLIQLVPDVRATRRPAGSGKRLHRSPRLVRGLSPGRRLDRPRPHVRPARRRGPHPALLHARPGRAPRR